MFSGQLTTPDRFSYHTGSDRHGKESRRLMCTRASAPPPLPCTHTSVYAVPVPSLEKEEGDVNHLRYGRVEKQQIPTPHVSYTCRPIYLALPTLLHIYLCLSVCMTISLRLSLSFSDLLLPDGVMLLIFRTFLKKIRCPSPNMSNYI